MSEGLLLLHLIVVRDKLSIELPLDILADLTLFHGVLSVGTLSLVRLVCHEWLLDLCSPSSHSLEFLDLENSATIYWLDVFAVALTVLFELFVDIE